MTPAFRFSRAALVTILLAAGGSGPLRAAGSLKVYLSAPFSQTAGSNGTSTTGGFTNAVTETFDNTNGANTGGTSSTGTFSSYNSPLLSRNTDTNTAITPTTAYATQTSGTTFSIIANGQYGGGSQGNYLGVPNGGATTLTLSQPVGYFGLEWCAVDAGNSLTLFDQNNSAIGTFNAATFQSLLPSNNRTSTIKAINGATYTVGDYFVQPTGTTTTTGRLNGDEQYAFLNFVCDPGTKISRITFSESTTAIFESDNHAILTTAPTVTTGSPLVFVSAVPEPSTVTFFAAAGGLMMLTFGRYRRRG